MKTDIVNGEKTYWVGMTEAQMKTMRFAVTSLLLAKESEIPMATAMQRTDHKIDSALTWETIEAMEYALGVLNKGAP